MAITKEDILEAVGNLTVMELNDLVKAFEEKFGVSAAAVAVAAGPAAGGAAAEAKTEFDVILASAGDQKVGVIKVVRKKPKTWLMALPKLLKKAYLKQKLTISRNSLKKLVPKLKLNKLWKQQQAGSNLLPALLR